MGVIQKLPQHLINKIKAGEIVERPASVVKELIENSLDAGATSIHVTIEKGGKQLMQIEDDGSGIAADDLLLTVERYATSKIYNEKDFQHIASYGFRGEALATISEVSGFRIQSRKAGDQAGVGHELWRDGKSYVTKDIAFAKEHGTNVFVQDIFHALPAREKFLKSDATEWRYIKKLFLQYALVHRNKHWSLTKEGKTLFTLFPAASLLERVLSITKKDREHKLKPLSYKDQQLELYGLVGDASLHFPSGDYVYVFVNQRPVEDRLLKKSLMDAYQRQIVPGSYPFVVLFVDVDPMQVDVNVHPRKQQVKFLDPGSMFTRVKESIQETIGVQKVNYAAFTKHPVSPNRMTQDQVTGLQSLGGVGDLANHTNIQQASYGAGHQHGLDLKHHSLVSAASSGLVGELGSVSLDDQSVAIIGQIWESYILLSGVEQVYLVDQHAVAERINFEKMKKKVQDEGFGSEILLQPLRVTYPQHVEVEPILESLQMIGFDVSLFGEGKVIIHAVPQVFAQYKLDIELVMQRVWTATIWQEKNDPKSLFGIVVDEILGMKACKASIKAGQKLSMLEMKQLIEDATTYIPGMFVCQHGRPSVVALPKSDVERLFERH